MKRYIFAIFCAGLAYCVASLVDIKVEHDVRLKGSYQDPFKVTVMLDHNGRLNGDITIRPNGTFDVREWERPKY